MLEKYSIELRARGDSDPFWRSPARGALMHGLLVQNVGSDQLHSNSSTSRPFTQNLEALGYGEYRWNINILNSEAARELKDWLFEFPNELNVQHANLTFAVGGLSRVTSISYADLFIKSMEEPLPKFATMEFLTPLIFKKAGLKHPHPWPEPRLIAQSVLKRWNEFSDTSKIETLELLERIAETVIPKHFSIQSQHIAMDGINMNGCVGQMTYQLPAQNDLRQIFSLVGHFAEFAGVGAKTSMGLGATRYLPDFVRQRSKNVRTEPRSAILSEGCRQ